MLARCKHPAGIGSGSKTSRRTSESPIKENYDGTVTVSRSMPLPLDIAGQINDEHRLAQEEHACSSLPRRTGGRPPEQMVPRRGRVTEPHGDGTPRTCVAAVMSSPRWLALTPHYEAVALHAQRWQESGR